VSMVLASRMGLMPRPGAERVRCTHRVGCPRSRASAISVCVAAPARRPDLDHDVGRGPQPRSPRPSISLLRIQCARQRDCRRTSGLISSARQHRPFLASAHARQRHIQGHARGECSLAQLAGDQARPMQASGSAEKALSTRELGGESDDP
jgi:hypothetical protein